MPSVAVFLGAKDAVRGVFNSKVEQLGGAIARAKIDIVYGGSNTGLMKRLADSALEHNGRVVGVTVDALATREAPHPALSKLHRVETMHQRKAMMSELADAFIIFPGGIGTLEEFFEVYTWAKLGFHSKPIGLLNIEGYFDPLLQLLDRAVEEGFFDQSGRDLLICESEVSALLASLGFTKE